jgi:tetratricopeptide (TPR) repeat protein
LSALLGDFDHARRQVDRALEFAPGDIRLIRLRGMLEFQSGDIQSGKSYWSRYNSTQNSVTASVASTSLGLWATRALDTGERVTITGESHLLDTLQDIARPVLSSPTAAPWHVAPTNIALGIAASANGDAESAREQYDALLPYRGTLPRLSEILIDRVLGNLAHTMDDRATATTHYEDGIAFCREAGYLPQLAWTLHDYANMLLDTDERSAEPSSASAQHPHATAMLDEALEISRDTGMRPLMERVLSRREILKA